MPKGKAKVKKEGKNKFFLVLGYIISLFFIIAGIAMTINDFGRDNKGVIIGVLTAAAGIVILPQIKLKPWIKGLLFLTLVIIAGTI